MLDMGYYSSNLCLMTVKCHNACSSLVILCLKLYVLVSLSNHAGLLELNVLIKYHILIPVFKFLLLDFLSHKLVLQLKSFHAFKLS